MSTPRFILKNVTNGWDSYCVLIDTETNTQIASDGGEPEDNSFGRDWSWVPDLLNQLADEIRTLKGEKH